MSRFVFPFAIIATGLFAVVAAVGYFAYGSSAKHTGRLSLSGLSEEVAVRWSDDGLVTIEASNESDVLAALGYVHAADHAWTIMLLRQAADGELAGWFGADYIELDKHARMLGFSQLARETFSQMPEEQKDLLRSYSRGVNLALSQNEVSQQDEFVLLDIIPQRWNPWDALTIERLISWIGASTVLTDTTYAAAAQADSVLVRFAATDSTFRGFLRLGGFDQSRAWVQRQNEGS
ncbi:MAG: penicillin acylase family protein, partial [Rubricoccaceae bacterium]|nr:penicillin acylase family protein [Rubricoccaceae bacterium]